MLPLFDNGALRVPVAETFALEDAADAYERFAAGGKLGRSCITISAAGPAAARPSVRRLRVVPLAERSKCRPERALGVLLIE